jgi:hypothetical protein
MFILVQLYILKISRGFSKYGHVLGTRRRISTSNRTDSADMFFSEPLQNHVANPAMVQTNNTSGNHGATLHSQYACQLPHQLFTLSMLVSMLVSSPHAGLVTSASSRPPRIPTSASIPDRSSCFDPRLCFDPFDPRLAAARDPGSLLLGGRPDRRSPSAPG